MVRTTKRLRFICISCAILIPFCRLTKNVTSHTMSEKDSKNRSKRDLAPGITLNLIREFGYFNIRPEVEISWLDGISFPKQEI